MRAEADTSSFAPDALPMTTTTSVAGSSPRNHGNYGSSVFGVRPTISPEAFYLPDDDGLGHTVRREENGELLQRDGSPDPEVEVEKAKMAKLLDEMAASVSHVAQRDLFHTLQRADPGDYESDELSAEELSDLARVGHVELTDEELAEVMTQMDVDENRRVSLSEFRAWWSGDSEIARRLRSALDNSKLGGTEYLSQVDSSLHWTSDRYSSGGSPGSAVPLPKSAQFVSVRTPRSSSETTATSTVVNMVANESSDVSQASTAEEIGSRDSSGLLEPAAVVQEFGTELGVEASSPKHRSVSTVAGGLQEQPSLQQLPAGKEKMVSNTEWAHGPPAPPLAGATVGLSTVAPRQATPSAAVATTSLGLSSFTALALSPVAHSVAGDEATQPTQRSDSAASDDSLGGPLFSSRSAAMAPPRSPNTTEPLQLEASASRGPRKLSEVLATLSSSVERERESIRHRTASNTSTRPTLTSSADWRAKHSERMEEFRLGSVARDGTLSSRLE